MTTLLYKAAVRPTTLMWWEIGKLLGLLVPFVLISSGNSNVILWAIAFHLFVDFTAQSGYTAANKPQRCIYVLVYHAFISGGYAGLIAGGLPGMAVSIAIHFMVDYLGKEKVGGWQGDQALHLATILGVYLCFS